MVKFDCFLNMKKGKQIDANSYDNIIFKLRIKLKSLIDFHSAWVQRGLCILVIKNCIP